ncbi:MAG: hypothetical protein M3N49_12300 [Candidatus Eremiobacteraeota bacterium]|nr:hypothetical protein [Candidatus Eremiobacteraeota bacterium]
MKLAAALACPALVLYPAVGSAEIKASIPAAARLGETRHGTPRDRAWWHGEQFVDLDTQTNSTRRTSSP